MSEYSKSMQGEFTVPATPVIKTILLPYKPISFEWWNKTAMTSQTTNDVISGIAFSSDPNGYAYPTYIATTARTTSVTITSGGISFVAAGTPTYGAVHTITGITAATPAVVTSASHGLQTGDVVLIYGTTGMLQIAGLQFSVTRIDANTFSINAPGAGFLAAATAGFFKQVLYPSLYLPGARNIDVVTTGTTTVVTVTQDHNFVVGQEVAFVIPPQWGMVELDSEYYLKTHFQPQQAYVTAVTATTVTVNINSTGFTAFAFPTSAVASLGVTPAQIIPIGDANTGYSGPVVPIPQTIPGAFATNTYNAVLMGVSSIISGPTTLVLQGASDVIHWRAEFPDGYISS